MSVRATVKSAMFTGILAGCAVVLVVVVLRIIWRRFVTRKRRLPPGPPGYPVIGNLLDLPKEEDWLRFSEWQKVYGDIVYVTALGKKFLIISSVKIASDLLERRSTYYSGRMKLTFGGELCGHDRSLALLEGTKHREARKVGASFVEFHSSQGPDEFVKHFHLNSGSTIMRIAYGYELDGDNDLHLRHANMVIRDFSRACAPGRWLVDLIPILKHVPEWFQGGNFKKIARKWRSELDECYSVPFTFASGDNLPSMISQLLESNKQHGDETQIANAVGSLFIAGSDTTPVALSNFIMAMILYPEVQKKAQSELDRVVGLERRPTLADRVNLPYVVAVVKEVLRWAPVVPTSVPHRLNREDGYANFCIPKDTLVVTNIW
ncbi:cytochrome P450 [Dacryopinax primogenitus]|uniref:Cytochrome P450 n=1 Tax=Dacryopinax primogenitus (strain DJM 731) TaxID=1858805 RepID=M5FNV2_DACPD|nr:cytochrome P450 [Dacryopinax primogenitus]EJT97960.1 cytochrome P450 [Dacryopinax primogenitus]